MLLQVSQMLLYFYSVLEQEFSRVSETLAEFIFGHLLIFRSLLVQSL